MEQFLCVNCVKHEELKDLIKSKGGKGLCALCKKPDFPAISCGDKELSSLFKSLVRFHYSQWEYDPHLGGEDIRSLFNKENLILNDWSPVGIDDGDDLWNVVEEITRFGNYDEEVGIYSDYPLLAIKDNYCTKIKSFEDQLEDKNYYEVEIEVMEFLRDIFREKDVTILKGANYYRARVGYTKSGFANNPSWELEKYFMPFKDKAIGSAPPPRAQNGRLNRQGVSFLYIASNSSTAVAEVRPYPGDCVSVGKFVSNNEIKVVDLANIKIGPYSSYSKLDKILTLKTINNLFSRPVPNQMGNQYMITQLLADVIRKLGYDGVAYKSSVGSGTNLAIFNPRLFNYTEEEASVVYIKGIGYSYDSCNIMCGDNQYSFIRDDNGELIK